MWLTECCFSGSILGKTAGENWFKARDGNRPYIL